MTLVSSGINTLNGLPPADTVEKVPADQNTRTKKYRLKVVPKQSKTANFHAVFVFAGEKAPSMSVVSLSKDVALEAYQGWKDIIKYICNNHSYCSTFLRWRDSILAVGS